MHGTPKTAVVTTEATDLAKDVFEFAFADADAHIVERGFLRCSAFVKVLNNCAPLRVIMEACGSAHGWARHFQRRGRHVELFPAHAVRP